MCLCFHTPCGLSTPSGCLLVRVGSSVSPAAIAILSKWEESLVTVLGTVGEKGLSVEGAVWLRAARLPPHQA